MIKQSTTQEQTMEMLDMCAFWTFCQEWPEEEPHGETAEECPCLDAETDGRRHAADSGGAAGILRRSRRLIRRGKRKLFLLHNTA